MTTNLHKLPLYASFSRMDAVGTWWHLKGINNDRKVIESH